MITNKIFALLTVSVIICFSAFPIIGQNTVVKNRLNIKASYAGYHTGWSIRPYSTEKIRTGTYRLEGNYGVSNNFEAGIYLGFYPSIYLEPGTGDYLITHKYIVPTYGLSLNWHILPYFIKEDFFRFDLYATTKIGGRYHNVPELDTFSEKHYTELFAGGGSAFYLNKHIGLFAEAGYYIIPKTEKISDLDHFLLRFGLSFNFKK